MKLDHDIPPPTRTNGPSIASQIRVLAGAGIDDSILIENAKVWSVRWTANRIGGAGWCIVRKEGNGARAWKLAEPTGGEYAVG